ncbi:MAG: tetratricopeptide repeat protein [Acidobacteriota bacterium]
MASSERYLRITAVAQRAFTRGQLTRSLRLFEAAEQESHRLGDRELVDRAFCNRCVVLAELDRLGSVATELKQVLMRSRDPFTSWMAAYYASQTYEFEGNVARALAYARRASELAQACGERRALVHSANQHGVLALKDSRFQEASERFEEALRLGAQECADSVTLAIIRDNLGYCLMCTGRNQEGLALCRDSAAALESTGTRQYLPEVYQDLCYGALQQGDLAEARLMGEKALAMAHEFSHPTVERNTLMLLADASMDAGDEVAADDFLVRLAAHYPDFRGMKAFLQAFNVREVINLKAV